MAALRALHASERQLLLAAQKTERLAMLAELRVRSSTARVVAEHAITARFQDRIATLPPGLSPLERHQAIQRLRLEEAMELNAFRQQTAQETAGHSSSARAALNDRQSAQRRGLTQRQRHQRATAAIMLRAVARSRFADIRRWRATLHTRLPPLTKGRGPAGSRST